MESVQIEPPAYADKDGIVMLQSKLVMVPNTGNDEISIVFL